MMADTERRPGPGGRPETRTEREARLLADASLVDMKRIAAMVGLSHHRVRDLRAEKGTWVALLADPATTPEQRAAAEEYLLDAIPDPLPDKIGNSPVWLANVIWAWGRRSRRLDEWYEPQPLAPCGRRPGRRVSRRRGRFTFAERLADLGQVDVPDGRHDELSAALLDAYTASRNAGARTEVARTHAVNVVAVDHQVSEQVCEHLLLRALLARRGKGGGDTPE